MTFDETLLPAAEALRGLVIAELDPHGDEPDQLHASDMFSAEELERVLRAVRDAIAAPVLALHVPAVNDRYR